MDLRGRIGEEATRSKDMEGKTDATRKNEFEFEVVIGRGRQTIEWAWIVGGEGKEEKGKKMLMKNNISWNKSFFIYLKIEKFISLNTK